jgi:hypothetical protein
VLGAIGMHLQIAPLEKISKNKRKKGGIINTYYIIFGTIG